MSYSSTSRYISHFHTWWWEVAGSPPHLLGVRLDLLEDGGEDGDEQVEQHHIPRQHVGGQEGDGEVAGERFMQY